MLANFPLICPEVIIKSWPDVKIHSSIGGNWLSKLSKKMNTYVKKDSETTMKEAEGLRQKQNLWWRTDTTFGNLPIAHFKKLGGHLQVGCY